VDDSFFDDEDWASDNGKLERVGQRPLASVVTEFPKKNGSVMTTPPPAESSVVPTANTERTVTTTTTTASSTTCVCHMPPVPKGDCDRLLAESQHNLKAALDLVKVKHYFYL
jgi:hypothetical protein